MLDCRLVLCVLRIRPGGFDHPSNLWKEQVPQSSVCQCMASPAKVNTHMKGSTPLHACFTNHDCRIEQGNINLPLLNLMFSPVLTSVYT